MIPKIKKILYATDLSPNSAYAFRYAINSAINHEGLLEYAERMGNSGVIRRLGYISDYYNLGLDIRKPETRGYLYVDPTLPHVGRRIARWRLIDNLTPIIERAIA